MAPFGFLVITFIIHGSVGQDARLWEERSVRWEEELKTNNIVAREDVIKSIRKFEPYWRSFGNNWVVMPDGDGNPRYSIMDDKKVEEKGKTLNFSDMDEKVIFYLYTRENPDGIPFTIETLNSIKINSTLPTRIICHGWMANSTSTITRNIKDAFLDWDGSNVIAVDWQYFSRNLIYVLSVRAVSHVGKHIGHMIDDLVMHKEVNYVDIHIVGHSLGAHVAGIAGDSAKGKIGRITGLDPALPGFGYIADRNGKLDNTDAVFVDVIHTCAGILGLSLPVGHVDFYPNGGSTCQPGCKSDGINVASTEACSHSRSHQFFAESINPKSKFIAVKCIDWDHFKNKQCDNVFETMGQYVSKQLSGIFYLKTNGKPPFAMGINGTFY